LSLPAPMVLGPKGPGRVGRRQANNHKDRYRVIDSGLFLLLLKSEAFSILALKDDPVGSSFFVREDSSLAFSQSSYITIMGQQLPECTSM
ncbi:hypothetical protein ACXZ7E_29015, partial [Paenibacillus lautus]